MAIKDTIENEIWNRFANRGAAPDDGRLPKDQKDLDKLNCVREAYKMLREGKQLTAAQTKIIEAYVKDLEVVRDDDTKLRSLTPAEKQQVQSMLGKSPAAPTSPASSGPSQGPTAPSPGPAAPSPTKAPAAPSASPSGPTTPPATDPDWLKIQALQSANKIFQDMLAPSGQLNLAPDQMKYFSDQIQKNKEKISEIKRSRNWM